MNNIIKFNKICKEIKKNIINIIINNYNYIIGKKYIINISHIYIHKDISYIKIYINFTNINNIYKIKKKINILKKNIRNIIKILKKKIYLKYIPKIYFKYDIFLNKINNLFNKIKNIK